MKTEPYKTLVFEYFCQISSKSIFIILSYTVSKLVRFFETQCIYYIYCVWTVPIYTRYLVHVVYIQVVYLLH